MRRLTSAAGRSHPPKRMWVRLVGNLPYLTSPLLFIWRWGVGLHSCYCCRSTKTIISWLPSKAAFQLPVADRLPGTRDVSTSPQSFPLTPASVSFSRFVGRERLKIPGSPPHLSSRFHIEQTITMVSRTPFLLDVGTKT